MLLLNKYLNGKVAEVIEHGIAVGSALLMAHGVSQSQATGLGELVNPQDIAGFVVAFLNVLWAAWRANAGNKLVSAVQSGAKGAQVLKSAAVITFLLVGLSAHAQTNIVTNTPTLSIPALTLGGAMPTNVVGAANDIIQIVSPIIPYFTNIHGLSLDLDGVYSSGKYGGIGALNVSIPGFMTNYLTVGIAGEFVGNQWFIAPVDMKLGVSYNIPVINIPAYSFVGTGLSVRPSDGAYGDQTLIGEAVSFQLGKGWYIVGDGGKLLLTQPNAPSSSWFGGFRIGRSF